MFAILCLALHVSEYDAMMQGKAVSMKSKEAVTAVMFPCSPATVSLCKQLEG